MMDFPIFKTTDEERATIWGILTQPKYAQYLGKKFEWTLSVFGIKVHPSMSVRGVLVDLIGPNPSA